MKLSDLLENRSNENVIYDLSDFTMEELSLFLNSKINGEDALSDSEMQRLEIATAKIKTRPGIPMIINSIPFDEDVDDPEEWLRNRWNQ